MIDKTKRDTKTIDNTPTQNSYLKNVKTSSSIISNVLCCYTLPPFRSSLLLYAPSISFFFVVIRSLVHKSIATTTQIRDVSEKKQ